MSHSVLLCVWQSFLTKKMIESCSQKRMLLAITVLGGLTLLVLVLESHLTSGNNRTHAASAKNLTSDCILREEFSIIEPCHPCSDFEVTSKSIAACLRTHFKETLKCHKTGTIVVRSCDKVTWLEERNFWIFEGFMLLIGLVSSTIVYARQKILDHRMLRRIQRQLASGVQFPSLVLISSSEANVTDFQVQVNVNYCDNTFGSNQQIKMPMEVLYVQVFSKPDNGWVKVPLETLITVFMVKYCFGPRIKLHLVLQEDSKPSFEVRVSGLYYENSQTESVPQAAKSCLLPVVCIENNTCVAGLCAVLRQLIKSVVLEEPNHWSRALLGFRQGCLVACAESSIWTRFCEVDMIIATNQLMRKEITSADVDIPEHVARFEAHMAQPIRMHNVQKKAQELIRKQGKTTYELSDVGVVEHCFAEGATMTLADVILFPCVHIIIECIRSVYLQQHIPLIMKWYENILEQDGIEEALTLIHAVPNKLVDDMYVAYCVPSVPKQSMYKSDPRRYKPRNRIFTRQEDIDASFLVVEALGLNFDVLDLPFGCDVKFDWESLPYDAQPEGGHLPASRRERKSQQLENLTKAVLKVAQPGQTIVDFCSGSGHLGIVLAHLLPRCHIVLLENKEESLGRARARVNKLGLSNVSFCQSNLDYFIGEFDIGTSLHACGVATDLVIQSCILQRAMFVCCPCCYGSVQNNHIITYPRSQFFRNSPMTLREYLVLGHSADQTHDENNVKTDQGKKCMSIIDTDRCLRATEARYFVSLAKLIPESCTPKNNLLVGIPKEWDIHILSHRNL